jgi:hypothetical protein
MLLAWEQLYEGQLLHAYEGHNEFPVCGEEIAKRTFTDKFPRTTYTGPTPAPPNIVCAACKTYERDRDPMFLEGVRFATERLRLAPVAEARRICSEDYCGEKLLESGLVCGMPRGHADSYHKASVDMLACVALDLADAIDVATAHLERNEP